MNNDLNPVIEVQTMGKTLISVCLIAYKHELFIEEAILGILNQELSADKELELIIADDNSPDETQSVVEKIQKSHIKGGLITFTKHSKNLGMMGNFMWLLNEAKGSYIALCEGDDYWTDMKKLETQVEFLIQNPSFVLTFHDADFVNSKGQIIEKSRLSINKIDNDIYECIELMQVVNLPTLSLVYRNCITKYPKEMLHANNADMFIISMLGKYGKAKALLNIKPAMYRIHEGGIWSVIDRKQKLLKRSTTFYFLLRAKVNKDLQEYYSFKFSKAHHEALVIMLQEKAYKEYFNSLFLFVKRAFSVFEFKYFILNFKYFFKQVLLKKITG